MSRFKTGRACSESRQLQGSDWREQVEHSEISHIPASPKTDGADIRAEPSYTSRIPFEGYELSRQVILGIPWQDEAYM
jgi:hypothetical protein